MATITHPKTYSTTLEALECGACAIPFAIPANLHALVMRDGRNFWCPNGHKISYSETENQRLQRELKAARRSRDYAQTAKRAAEDQAQAAEYRRRAAVGQVTKIRNRIANGVCPCCNRTFVNLERHMSTKHPDYTSSSTES